jgi:hypothetical protein
LILMFAIMQHVSDCDGRAIFRISSNKSQSGPTLIILVFFDKFLSARLRVYLAQLFPHMPGVFHGAMPGTQCTDISHAANLLMEKGLDLRGHACIAQGDVKAYFDSLPMVRNARWLLAHSVPSSLVGALLRHHLFTKLQLQALHGMVEIKHRCRGGLTGSTVALTLSQIPIKDAVQSLYKQLQILGFEVSKDLTISVATWVDNLSYFASSMENATEQSVMVSRCLAHKWVLAIKMGSRQLLQAQGGTGSATDEWQIYQAMPVLGWQISASASTTPQLELLRTKVCFKSRQALKCAVRSQGNLSQMHAGCILLAVCNPVCS